MNFISVIFVIHHAPVAYAVGSVGRLQFPRIGPTIRDLLS
jgi:hypothetical protein